MDGMADGRTDEQTDRQKMLGCFNPTLGQIWTNPNVGLKNVIKKFNPMAGFVHI